PIKVLRPLARYSSKTPKKKSAKAKAATILAGSGMRPNALRQLIRFVRCCRNPLPEAFFEKAEAAQVAGMAAAITPRRRSAIRRLGDSSDWPAMPKGAT